MFIHSKRPRRLQVCRFIRARGRGLGRGRHTRARPPASELERHRTRGVCPFRRGFDDAFERDGRET